MLAIAKSPTTEDAGGLIRNEQQFVSLLQFQRFHRKEFILVNHLTAEINHLHSRQLVKL